MIPKLQKLYGTDSIKNVIIKDLPNTSVLLKKI